MIYYKITRTQQALWLVNTIEIIDIECGLLSRVSQKIVATKWRIYKGRFFCQIGPLSRDRARILYLIISMVNTRARSEYSTRKFSRQAIFKYKLL